MKRVLLCIALVGMAGSSAFAQLSTRDNNATNVRLGARPLAGDAALQFNIPIVGRSANDGTDAGLYNGNLLGAGDVLTFKYYNSDDVAYRVGIRLAADNTTIKGDAADSVTTALPGFPVGETFESAKFRTVSREYIIAPGIEKHFTNSNIFDVYVGADVLLGLGRDKSISEVDLIDGDKDYETRTVNTKIAGLGAFVGVNVFIAQLPISVGLEYGLSGKYLFGGRTKVVKEMTIGDESESAEWFEDSSDINVPGLDKYSKLSRREFNMDTNHNVRLNICIYFSSKTGSSN